MRALLALALLTASAAAQETPCGPREVIAARIAQWGEVAQFAGVAQDGTLVEMWGNPASQTWTMTVTRPNGASCLTGAGTGWIVPLPVKPGRPT